MKWEDEELAELDKLKEMFREARMLNTANNTIQRMERLIELATELSESKWRLTEEDGKRHRSFYEKLEEDAREYWKRKREQSNDDAE